MLLLGFATASGIAEVPSDRVQNRVESTNFNHEAAAKLTTTRRKQLDIEFFNEFTVKSESGPGGEASARAARIRRMANEGFEVAYLADRLYNFERLGIPSFRPDYADSWNRLKELARQGDSSAQCLFAFVAAEYRSFNQDPPTRHDEEVLGSHYRKAASEQDHPYCGWLWAGNDSRIDEQQRIRLEAACAREQVVACQTSRAARYAEARGVPKDRVKGLCWLAKARSSSSSLRIENWFRVYRSFLRDEIGSDGVARVLHGIGPETDCDTFALR
jgi:hypothetical protein